MAQIKSNKKPRSIPDGKTQVNFNLRTDLLEKVKFIVYQENSNNSDLYNEAIALFVDRYESKNGKIKPRKSN